jgi:lipoprotein-anchoring transpeptidase ErfK/SrfK
MEMKNLIVTIAVVMSSITANAMADLTDFASPAELATAVTEPQAKTLQQREQARLVIVVNKAERGTAKDAQTLEAFLDGELLYRTVVSTGKEKPVMTPPSKRYPKGHKYIAHTPAGAFSIKRRSINHVSGTWAGASMPFAQFFRGGIAIHATTPNHFAQLGQRDSGGCVRLHPRDAKIMWNLVGEIGTTETEIIIYDGKTMQHPLGRAGEAPRYVLSNPVTGAKGNASAEVTK